MLQSFETRINEVGATIDFEDETRLEQPIYWLVFALKIEFTYVPMKLLCVP